MKGTSFSQILETFFRPPTITNRADPHTIAAGIQGSMPKFAWTTLVIALVCTAEPIPKIVKQAITANQIAASFAHQGTVPSGRLKRCSHTCIAPPIIWPRQSFTRYFMAAKTSVYLVAIPKIPVSHIHKTAPGPPERTAVATPIMEPVPSVEASDVAIAPKLLTSPSAPSSFVTESFKAKGSLRWIPLVRIVV